MQQKLQKKQIKKLLFHVLSNEKAGVYNLLIFKELNFVWNLLVETLLFMPLAHNAKIQKNYSGDDHFNLGKGQKSRSVVIHSLPVSIASAARKASGIKFPFVLASLQSLVKISQCLSCGETMMQLA